MKKILFLSLLIGLAFTACKKDKLGTKPVLTFKSYSTGVVDASVGMDVTFGITDGDGDIESSFNYQTLFDSDPDQPTDSSKYDARQMPGLENHKGGKITADVILHLNPNDFIKLGGAKDSVRYRVFVLDNEGNSSDTILTPKIEVIFP